MKELKDLQYEGGYISYICVTVYYQYDTEGIGHFMAYEDGEMCDEIDYKPYEVRFLKGESFEKVAESIIIELRNTR